MQVPRIDYSQYGARLGTLTKHIGLIVRQYLCKNGHRELERGRATILQEGEVKLGRIQIAVKAPTLLKRSIESIKHLLIYGRS